MEITDFSKALVSYFGLSIWKDRHDEKINWQCLKAYSTTRSMIWKSSYFVYDTCYLSNHTHNQEIYLFQYGYKFADIRSLKSYIYLNQKGFLEKSREVG